MRVCVRACVRAFVCVRACVRASERECVRVFLCACACVRVCETTIIVKARPAAHCNFAAAATLSMRQRQSSSASVIGRLQFLRWGFLRFSSRVSPVVPSSDHQISTRGQTNCSPVGLHTMMVWRQSFCRMNFFFGCQKQNL